LALKLGTDLESEMSTANFEVLTTAGVSRGGMGHEKKYHRVGRETEKDVYRDGRL
jgi:hypothetical protein